MLRCEQRREYLISGKHEWRWKEVPVADAADAAANNIRCMHCHGAVRIHRQKVPHGPQDRMYSRGIPTLMLAKIRSVRSQSRGRAGMRIALQIIL